MSRLSSTRTRAVVFSLAVPLVLVLIAGINACSPGTGSESNATPPTAAADPPRDTKAPTPRRSFTEGGKLTLNTPSGPVDVTVTDAVYANTDAGYPDLVEIEGKGMYIVAQVAGKVEEDDQEQLLYGAFVGKPLPVATLDPGTDSMTIEIPGSGPYTVAGGTLTLERFEHGPSTTDWWEGRIELNLQTTAGAYPVTGTFSFGIVPVW